LGNLNKDKDIDDNHNQNHVDSHTDDQTDENGMQTESQIIDFDRP
jgi:hypothetical protein